MPMLLDIGVRSTCPQPLYAPYILRPEQAGLLRIIENLAIEFVKVTRLVLGSMPGTAFTV